ncbi:type II secretion system protein [Clostridium autoethanogenum]|uniref:Type II secretion system GspH family protein n=1 Tax=Clostridium autoethanogenum DSM 10061 TaxID=1341692 RepID=A0ABN4BLA1_9CLOT|nr:type II secretion system protein [Clostridium autoethanogenum]AGY76858.2 type II secretion system GspH family protein [Clostridium autoethanogenum DSM 10061]
MKKRGFTYIEVMMAISVFIMLSVFVIRLNIAANKNVNKQVLRQNMMMEAQRCLEESKNDPDSRKYKGSDYKKMDGYYVNISSIQVKADSPNLFQITVRVRNNIDDEENEVVLKSHFLKK